MRKDLEQLAEQLAMRAAARFQVPGMSWSFDDIAGAKEIAGYDRELLELTVQVLFPAAVVYLATGKSV